MEYSKAGLSLTEGFEHCRLLAYPDSGGVLTIGWGHVGPEVLRGMMISQAQADKLLLSDVAAAVNAINHLVKVPLSQDEFDGLTDFAFNCGVGAFRDSHLLVLLNQGDIAAAAYEFQRWDRCKGVVMAGLLRRREAEETLFEKPDVSTH
jgi:lysozyme